MRRLLLLPLLFLLFPSAASAADQIKVMSRNLYLGADLIPLAVYGKDQANLGPFSTAATVLWKNVQATDFHKRSQALARELKQHKPALVGLQEAALWQRSTGKSGKPSRKVYDFTAELLKAARRQGMTYRVVVSQDEFVFTAPTDLGYKVRLTMRDVLLVRVGARITVSRPRSGRYRQTFKVDTPVGVANSRRGWVSARVKTRSGKTATVFNTHLEAYGDDIRLSQAQQLAARVGATRGPVVVLGDLNSDPTSIDTSADSARTLLSLGMTSAFSGEPTCCQQELLTNADSALTSWIDHILLRDLSWLKSGLTGNLPADRLFGLWPSDHAGVWATLSLGR